MQQVKLQAATALNKAGILSTSELEMIKKEVNATGLLENKQTKKVVKKKEKTAPKTTESAETENVKSETPKQENKDESKDSSNKDEQE